MPKVIKQCKVCGVDYEACRTERSSDVFRWQDVACCPEHGAEYFRMIAESRGAGVKAPVKKKTPRVEAKLNAFKPKGKEISPAPPAEDGDMIWPDDPDYDTDEE